ncbi:hypothetical protein WJX72_008475 [[Myrmecia] bisecta]|uniref:Glutathione S-transferase n=1 Tax=[Myrmecia] bisecta TaxID=41462 RepID=A0AAW1QBS6_9CHLO
MAIKVYELAGADGAQRFSPYCWMSVMALAHKGLQFEGIPWRFSEQDAIAFSGQGKVPVVVDGDKTIADSWAIAEYLEATYSDKPSLFNGPGGKAGAQFVTAWAETTLMPIIFPLVVADVHSVLRPEDAAYFRETREKVLGVPLEEACTDKGPQMAKFRAALEPLRAMLAKQPFLGGDAPSYSDYVLFGYFMFARNTYPQDLLEASDAVYAWREKLLDAFGGLARKSKSA